MKITKINGISLIGNKDESITIMTADGKEFTIKSSPLSDIESGGLLIEKSDSSAISIDLADSPSYSNSAIIIK